MDTGFGAVIVRFEATYGKRITDFILALFGLSSTVVFLWIIWTLAVGPAFAWLSTKSINFGRVESVAEVAWYAGGVAFGYAFVHLLLALSERNRLRAEVAELKAEKEGLEEEIAGIEEALDKAGV